MAPLASATEAASEELEEERAAAGKGGRDAVAMSGIKFFNRSVRKRGKNGGGKGKQ